MGGLEVAMADLNISAVGGTERVQLTTTTDQTKAADQLKEQIKEESSRKEHVKEVLEDVIAKSKDGDTAQASKKSQDLLKDSEEIGDVKKMPDKKDDHEPSAAMKLLDEIMKKQQDKPSPAERMKETLERQERLKNTQADLSEKPNLHTQAEAREASNKTKTHNYNSYSDAQLQQMYINGDITRYDYDHEMEGRTEKGKENADEARNEKIFNEGIVRVMENERQAEISGSSIENAFSDYSNDNMRAEQRMAMLDAAELLT